MNQIIHSANKKRAAVLYSNNSDGPIEARIYANRKRLRNWADRKDNEYGAVRFVCRLAKQA